MRTLNELHQDKVLYEKQINAVLAEKAALHSIIQKLSSELSNIDEKLAGLKGAHNVICATIGERNARKIS